MRAGLAVALALLALPAAAQSPPRLTPLGPTQAPRPSAPELPAVQTPTPPGAPIQSQQLPSLTAPDPAFVAPRAPAAVPPASPPAPPPATPTPTPPATTPSQPGTAIPGDWQARGTTELVALDKVTARSSPLTAKTGETVRFGTLAITVRACAVRPPDQPADATTFLEITDRGGTTPIFRGWMFAASPSLAVLEHPVYDIRVIGCRP